MTPFSIFRVLSVLVVALALAGCGGGATETSDSSSAGGSTSEASADAGEVTIADLAFSPSSLEVAAGTEVTWTSNDDAPHTVSFDDDALTDSEELNNGDTFSTTFDEAGEFSYVCAIHPDMKGTVTVQ